MTTDFWTRVLAEYDAVHFRGDVLPWWTGCPDPDGEWALCCTSETFRDAYYTLTDHDAINSLAGQFLANTDAGQRFQRGHVYLFHCQQRPDCSDDEHVAALRAVRRDFLLWARDNDRNDNTRQPAATPGV